MIRKYLFLLILIFTLSGCASLHKTVFTGLYEYQDRIEDLKDGTVYIGMPYPEVKELWGSPLDINRTVGDWGIHDQVIYGHRDFGAFTTSYEIYLYFDDGILTSWQIW